MNDTQASPRNANRVLVVDDDPDILDTVDLYFSERGFDVVTARSGTEGLNQVHVAPPDLIILDLMMPGMSGTEFMVRLRELGIHIPIIIITADTEAPRRMKGRTGDGLFLKPFKLSELAAATERVLERAPGH